MPHARGHLKYGNDGLLNYDATIASTSPVDDVQPNNNTPNASDLYTLAPTQPSNDLLPHDAVEFSQMDQPGTRPLAVDESVPAIDLWTAEQNAPDASWLLGKDFDITALNASIAAAVSNWNYQNSDALHAGDLYDAGDICRLSPETVISTATPLISEIWHTLPALPPASRCASWSFQDQDQVDESYRVNLSQRLTPKLRDGMLPSSQFLVSRCSDLITAGLNEW